MKVAVAGAHGQIAQLLIDRLVARGDTVVGLVRNPDHVAPLSERGAMPVVCDLESAPIDDIVQAIHGCDAAVFAAGSGPGQSAERKLSMDRDGALKLLDASVRVSVVRFVIVSAVGADDPPDGDDVFSVYLRAKAEADAAVQLSNREWTVIRPGRLTDDPGTDRVDLTPESVRGEIPRADVAAVLAAVLAEPRTAGLTLSLNTGDQTVADAVAAVAGRPRDDGR